MATFDTTLPGVPYRVRRTRSTTRPPVSFGFVRLMALLFLIKPSVDLTWSWGFQFLHYSFSLLQLSGALVALVGAMLLIARFHHRSFAHTLFAAFLLQQLVSLAMVMSYGGRIDMFQAANVGLRIFDSFVLLHLGYLVGLRKKSAEGLLLLKGMFTGNMIALLLNAIVLTVDAQVTNVSAGVERYAGVYYDAGVLAINAVQNAVFACYLFDLRKTIWRPIAVCSMLLSSYCMLVSVSRAAVVLLAAALVIYAIVYRRAQGTIGVAAIAAALMCVVIASGIDMSRFEHRFMSEIEVWRKGIGDIDLSSGSSLSLGNLEALGNNRGRLITAAMKRILKRPGDALLLGFFFSSTSHCDYVDILARNGIFGLFLYLWLLAYVWAKTLRYVSALPNSSYRLIAAIAFTFVSMYILYSLPFRPLLYTTNSWYMWCLVGYCLGAFKGGPPMRRVKWRRVHTPAADRQWNRAVERSSRVESSVLRVESSEVSVEGSQAGVDGALQGFPNHRPEDRV
jgi:hypothetical protein